MNYAIMPLLDYDAVCDKIREKAESKVIRFENTDFGYIRSASYAFEEGKTYTINIIVADNNLSVNFVVGSPEWKDITPPWVYEFEENSFTAPSNYSACVYLNGLTIADIVSATIECNGEIVADFVEPLKIKSGEMADKVEDVYDAGKDAERANFWESFFKNGVFGGMFSGGGWNVDTFKPIYPAEKILVATRYAAERLFSNFNRPNSFAQPLVDLAEFCEHADFSQCPYLDFTFSDARAKNLTLDLSSCTGINRAFGSGNGGVLENIKLKVTATCTAYPNAFFYQSELTSLVFTEDSVIAANISFAQCGMLNDESINGIINALQDRNGSTTLTLTVHKNVYNRMVADGRNALVTAKNWTLVSA